MMTVASYVGSMMASFFESGYETQEEWEAREKRTKKQQQQQEEEQQEEEEGEEEEEEGEEGEEEEGEEEEEEGEEEKKKGRSGEWTDQDASASGRKKKKKTVRGSGAGSKSGSRLRAVHFDTGAAPGMEYRNDSDVDATDTTTNSNTDDDDDDDDEHKNYQQGVSSASRKAAAPTSVPRTASTASSSSSAEKLNSFRNTMNRRIHSVTDNIQKHISIRPLPDLGLRRGIPRQFLANSWTQMSPQDQMEVIAKLHAELDRRGTLKPEHDAYTLHRFLRARKFNLEDTIVMFERVQKWREENKVDSLLEEFEFTEQEEFGQIYRQGYHRTDKMGRPIYIEKLEGVSYERLIAITTEDRVMKKAIQEYEKLMKVKFPACSVMAGRHIDQSFSILDVGGIKIKDFNKDLRRMLKNLLGLASDNYPETMGKMFIINAPTIFTIIWSFVKRVVDPRTVAKIDVVGSNYLPKLLMYVDAENLPVQFGGLDTTPWPGVEPGPWDVYRSNNIRHLFTDDGEDDRVMPKKYSVAAADQESPISHGDAAASAAPAAAAVAEEIAEFVGARGGFQSPEPSMPKMYNAADAADAVPSPVVSPSATDTDTESAMRARVGLLEADAVRYKTLLLTPTDAKVPDLAHAATLGERIETLEQAMAELKKAVDAGGDSQTHARPAECCIIQ